MKNLTRAKMVGGKKQLDSLKNLGQASTFLRVPWNLSSFVLSPQSCLCKPEQEEGMLPGVDGWASSFLAKHSSD
jgi:hypothetical protein